MTNTNIIIESLKLNGATPEFLAAFIKAGCPLHTYAEWKRLGYQVKKGEHAALRCYLWQYTSKPGKGVKKPAENEADQEEQQNSGHFYKKLSFLFWPDQLEGAKSEAMKAPVAGYLPAPEVA